MTEINTKACERFLGLINASLDGTLTAEEVSFMQAHAAECDSCAREFRIAREMMEYIGTVDDNVVVPLKAQNGWRQSVRREAAQRKTARLARWASGIAAALLVVVGSVALLRNDDAVHDEAYETTERRKIAVPSQTYVDGAMAAKQNGWVVLEADGGDDSFMVMEDMAATGAAKTRSAESEEEPEEEITVETVTSQDSPYESSAGSMMVCSSNVVAGTDQFDLSRRNLSTLAEEYGGYLASDELDLSNPLQRVSRTEMCVPVELVEESLAALENFVEISSIEIHNENVSDYYYDAESRCASQNLLVNRLNGLISTSSGDELISLNQQLQEAYDRIDELERLIHAYQTDIRYANVVLELYETSDQFGVPGAVTSPVATKEPTLSERSASGFRQSMTRIGRFFEDMIVSLAIIAPVLMIAVAVACLVGVTIWIVRARRKATKSDEEIPSEEE